MNTEKSYENFADLRHYSEKYLPQIDKSLREYLPSAPPKIEKEFNQVVEFALFSGEKKRIRPILTLLGAELFGGKAENVLPAATAVEFIYTCSQIFDELSFYNSESRKSLSENYGDGLVVLTAIGLLNASYSLVFVNHIGMPERAMQAHQEIVECVAAEGLIGGLNVVKNANSTGFVANTYSSEQIKNVKTSALLRLALRVGAILSGADYLDQANLSRFAEIFGDAYQMSEDLEQKSANSAISQSENSTRIQLASSVEEAKRFLVENFPSNEARSCLIQLTEFLAKEK